MTATDTEGTAGDRSVAVVVAAVAASLAFTAVHGVAHASIPVPTVGWQTAFVAILLFALPVLGAVFAVRRRVATGARLALVGGLAALTFESLAHFAAHNPDHVSTVRSGRVLFAGTAGLSIVGDALLVLAAWWVFRAQAHGSSTSSRSDSIT